MKRQIKAAQLVRYNANDRGNSVGDCVKRSMSYAFNMSYNDISKLLLAKMKEKRYNQWNVLPVFTPVIEELGGKNVTSTHVNGPTTLDEFADKYNTGTYILLVGDMPGSTSHAVCVVDGKVYDSWDSREKYVTTVWLVTEDADTSETFNIAQQFDSLALVIQDTIEKYLNKYAAKYDWLNIDGLSIRVTRKAYTLYAHSAVAAIVPEIDYDESVYIKLPYVFNPRTTYDEALKQIENVTKVKIYDKLYAANAQVKAAVEAYSVNPNYKKLTEKFYLDDQERRFYNSLPGWVKGIAEFLDIQSPNMYHDSYTLRTRSLPGDPNPEDRIYFEAYNSAQLRDMLKRYHDNWEHPYRDYSPSEDY